MITIIFKESGEKVYENYLDFYFEGSFFVVRIDSWTREIWPANSIWKISVEKEVNDEGIRRT